MSKFDTNVPGNIIMKANGNLEFHLLDILNSKKMTRYSLSKITGIRFDTICNYCKGDVTLINAEYLKIFCDVLDCNISDLITYKK